VLGRLDRVLELALAVDDHAGYGAAVRELRFFLQEVDLGLHFVELVVGGVCVLGVDDPDGASPSAYSST
jgi:hypothetical protein